MKLIKRFFFIPLFGFLVSSCGMEDVMIIKKIVYAVDEKEVEVGAEFSDLLELELEARIPIKNDGIKYGTLNFIPPSRSNGSIFSFSLNINILEDQDFISRAKVTRKLPNGSPMSSYIDTDLLWLRFQKQKKKFRPSLYLGTQTDNMYLAGAMELDFLDDDFPEKLTISQRFKDAKGRYLGVVTLFGPELNQRGEIKIPGGFFFATNLSDLKRYLQEGKSVMPEFLGDQIIITKDGESLALDDKRVFKWMKLLKKKVKKFNKKQS